MGLSRQHAEHYRCASRGNFSASQLEAFAHVHGLHRRFCSLPAVPETAHLPCLRRLAYAMSYCVLTFLQVFFFQFSSLSSFHA